MPRADAPTRELTTAPTTGSEDRCTNCGAPLAHDQRYCVNCGERRGQSRLPTAQPTTEVRTTRSRSSRPPRGQRVSSGTTLVAGVGVLLLAIGLGFLIGRVGHTSNQKAASAPPVQVVTVNGGGGSASTTPTTTTRTTAASSTPKGLSGKLKKAADQTAPPSKAVQQEGHPGRRKGSRQLEPPGGADHQPGRILYRRRWVPEPQVHRKLLWELSMRLPKRGTGRNAAPTDSPASAASASGREPAAGGAAAGGRQERLRRRARSSTSSAGATRSRHGSPSCSGTWAGSSTRWRSATRSASTCS